MVILLPCSRCKRELPLDSFCESKGCTGRHGRHSWCKSCNAEARRSDRQADPEHHRALGRKHARIKRLRRHGLTPETFAAMLGAQGGVCAICREPETVHASLAIDHDHATGAVRGLLCFLCNTAIGKLGDNPARLRAAADYIERARP